MLYSSETEVKCLCGQKEEPDLFGGISPRVLDDVCEELAHNKERMMTEDEGV